MQWKGAGVVVVTLAVAVAGCGGSSSNAPTRADFVKRADTVCRQASQTIGRYMTAHANQARTSGAAMAQFVLDVVAKNEAFVKHLGTVEPPAELKSDFGAYLSTLRLENSMERQVVRLAPPSAEGLVKHHTPAYTLSNKRKVQVHKAFHQAQALGLQNCGG